MSGQGSLGAWGCQEGSVPVAGSVKAGASVAVATGRRLVPGSASLTRTF